MFNTLFLKWCLLTTCVLNFTCCTSTGISYCLENRRGLLFVSTLDGVLSALDINDEGKEKWAIHTGPGTLLSSNIHDLELIENSKWVTLVPSLTGKLYKFDGQTVQPIPFNADNLLTSSFRFSDDVVISGGKETRFYGVNLNNGEILYECSMANCDNQTGNGEATKDIIVLQRHTHTIRAIEPRTGHQRWNFSVGNHDLRVIPLEECTDELDKLPEIEIQVQGPNGVIFGINPSDSGLILWNHKFESPITNVWKLVGNTLEKIDLFSSSTSHDLQTTIGNNPLLYMGIYEQQLYIQESAVYRRQQMWGQKNDDNTDSSEVDTKRITMDNRERSVSKGLSKSNAISLFNKPHNRAADGYYFYDNNRSHEPKELHKEIEHVQPDDETVGEVVIMTLWYYWKEVLLISLSTAIIVNYIIYRHMYPFVYWHVLPYFEKKSRSSDANSNEDGNTGEKRNVSKEDTDSGISVQSSSNENYCSRYLQDFECVHLLGKGGFGVVYHARNIIDDCHYAVKRISLPSGKKRREQVLREVRALAKLDHPNIVRFFNAWLEYPPAGWQHPQEKTYLPSHDTMITNSMISGDHNKQYNNDKINTELNTSATKSSTFNTKFDKFTEHPKTTTDSSFIVFERDSNLNTEEKSNDSKGFKDDSKCDGLKDVDKCKNDGCLALLYIQMQLCQKSSLKDWLRANTTERQPTTVTSIFTQILTAVVYIHQQGMIHRDLKPSNIFFSLDGQIKVGDFGLVTCLEESNDTSNTNDWNNLSLTNNAGTHIYMSPEQFSRKGYNFKVDIYALGIILFELITPFDTEMERYKTLINLRSGIFPHSFISTHKTEYKLLTMMLSHNPEIRPTAEKLKESLK